MTENEAIERLKCMRLFMEINDKQNESKFLEDDYIANEMAIKALEEIQQYRAIGTVEEFKVLKEKNEPKKPIIRPWSDARCPSCGCSLSESLGDGYYKHFESLERCDECNQKLDWQ